MCEKAIKALQAELKIVKNIQKSYPNDYIVVAGGRMLRGLRDYSGLVIMRFNSPVDPARGPFSHVVADADGVTVHSYMDAVNFATAAQATKGASSDAAAMAVNSAQFKAYATKLAKAAEILSGHLKETN